MFSWQAALPILAAAMVYGGCSLVGWRRHAAPAACASAVAAGWPLLDGTVWVPSREWHWLLYLTAGAAVLGPVASLTRLPERWLVYAVWAAAAGWLVTPAWVNDKLPTPQFALRTAAVAWLASELMHWQARSTPTRRLLFYYAVAATAATGLIAAQVSLRLAETAALGAAGLGGCWLMSWLAGGRATLEGLAPTYVALVGVPLLSAWLYLPTAALLCLGLTPLAAWPLPDRWSGGRAGVWIELALLSAAIAVCSWLTVSFEP